MLDRSVYLRRRIILGISALVLLALFVSLSAKGMRWIYNRSKYANIRVVAGGLKQGQVLFDSLLENNISREAAIELVNSIDKVLDLRTLKVSDKYSIYLDKNNKIIKFIYEKSPDDLYFAVRNKDDIFIAFKPAVYLNKKTIAKEFMIKSSLFEAMLKNKEEDALVFLFVDIFAWDIDFYTYPRVGDRIRIYFEKYYKDGKFVKYGRILAAQYAGREKFDAVYFVPKNNRPGYYDLNGKPVEKFFLKSPLKFTGRVTSYFGYRSDPFTSRHSRHRGVDFAAYYGAPIVATSSGQVTFAGWRGAYGRLVILRHSNGYSTYYGHCSKLMVRPGQSVSQGQLIASVGSTGRSTGPHVHYEIRMRDSNLNPLKFNQPKRSPLKDDDLRDFNAAAGKVWKNIDKI